VSATHLLNRREFQQKIANGSGSSFDDIDARIIQQGAQRRDGRLVQDSADVLGSECGPKHSAQEHEKPKLGLHKKQKQCLKKKQF
jgi:hypothetical protein